MLLLGEYQRVCADLVSVKRALQGPRAAPPTAGSALTFTAPPLRGASRH